MEEELKESLAVIGPSAMNDLHHRHHQRSFTAPPATVSSLEMWRYGAGGGERREAPKTAKSSVSIRNLLNPSTKLSITTFPARPPLSKGKQIPGHFFPKPMLTEEQKAQLELFRRMKPHKVASLQSTYPSIHGDSGDGASSVSRMDRQHRPSYNKRIALTRQQLQNNRPEVKSEVFAICFKHDMDMISTAYDPHSELHSDYYSIKRLKMPVARLGRPVKTTVDDFAVVLRGQRKHLHNKFLLSAESTESLVESITQTAMARSGGNLTRRTLLDERESPRKIIDIETPKTGPREADDQSEMSGTEHDQDITLAPLNSPSGTDNKDAFPALV